MVTVILDRHIFWHQQDVIYQWCIEHFGNPQRQGRWWCRTIFGHGDFEFLDEKDAILFKLTWYADEWK